MGSQRYVPTKLLNVGGMAEIYVGKATGEFGFERLVAIKRIKPQHALDATFLRMFQDEANICRQLHSSNIVQIVGFEEVEGAIAIVMEFVSGLDLKALTDAAAASGRAVPAAIAVYVAAMAARGLHYAHSKVDEASGKPLNIVHRDVSPHNILVSFDGEVKVGDFGIAATMHRLTETQPGIIKGKYSYLSPEQAAGAPLDGRSDQYSLGICLWEVLARRRLFHGDNDVETFRLVRKAHVPAFLDVGVEVDPRLEAIVRKALAPEPERRFATAGDFEAELLKFLHGQFADFSHREVREFVLAVAPQHVERNASLIRETMSSIAVRPLLSQPPRSLGAGPERESRSPPVHDLGKAGTNAREGTVQVPRVGGMEPGPRSAVGDQAKPPAAADERRYVSIAPPPLTDLAPGLAGDVRWTAARRDSKILVRKIRVSLGKRARIWHFAAATAGMIGVSLAAEATPAVATWGRILRSWLAPLPRLVPSPWSSRIVPLLTSSLDRLSDAQLAVYTGVFALLSYTLLAKKWRALVVLGVASGIVGLVDVYGQRAAIRGLLEIF